MNAKPVPKPSVGFLVILQLRFVKSATKAKQQSLRPHRKVLQCGFVSRQSLRGFRELVFCGGGDEAVVEKK
jgi:hypothetical protein